MRVFKFQTDLIQYIRHEHKHPNTSFKRYKYKGYIWSRAEIVAPVRSEIFAWVKDCI